MNKVSILDLTVEQVNLICAVIDDEKATKESVIAGIFEMLPDITDKEMIAIAEKTVFMLEDMSEEYFEECHFSEIMEA